MTLRHPAVAGQFYPSKVNDLVSCIQEYTRISESNTSPVFGCVVPHAGYVYSGGVAGAVFAHIKLPQRVVILCPNHTGAGTPLSILSQGSWLMPLGEVAVDTEMAEALKAEFPLLREDEAAQRHEHAIEVQLPFLQILAPGFRFTPIVVGTSQPEVLFALGIVLARVLSKLAPKALIIASSDMNHYESDKITRAKDSMAIEQLLQLNPEGLLQVVEREQITMCGVAPAAIMLTAVKRMGASKAELVKYATSGDAFNERDRVVGYAGVTFA